MKISSLWVVTKATSRSTMQDICFRVELPLDLYRQFMGGLDPDNIVAFYDNQSAAEEKARHELHAAQHRVQRTAGYGGDFQTVVVDPAAANT